LKHLPPIGNHKNKKKKLFRTKSKQIFSKLQKKNLGTAGNCVGISSTTTQKSAPLLLPIACSSICLNGATCTNNERTNNITCTCASGFTGLLKKKTYLYFVMMGTI
jgi:hypothetical protein